MLTAGGTEYLSTAQSGVNGAGHATSSSAMRLNDHVPAVGCWQSKTMLQSGERCVFLATKKTETPIGGRATRAIGIAYAKQTERTCLCVTDAGAKRKYLEKIKYSASYTKMSPLLLVLFVVVYGYSVQQRLCIDRAESFYYRYERNSCARDAYYEIMYWCLQIP